MGGVNAPRYPLLHIFCLVVLAALFVWGNLVIMACLWVGQPVWSLPVNLSIVVLLLVAWSKSMDRYSWVREHLMAERKLAREYRALQACSVVLSDRVSRGELVYGTPLHKVALVRKRRAFDALRAAEGYRVQNKAA